MKTATMLASPDLHAGRKAVRKSATKAGKWAM
jgi:hypothetical protein